MEKVRVFFNLNGEDVSAEIDPSKRLLDIIREDFGITSVKEGCSEGECGACTVILNGEAVTSCCMLGPQVDGCSVITVEGLEKNGELHVLQQAFLDAGAVQCGFCTPGMVLSAKALLMKNQNPTLEEIKTAISGNLCRCTGYKKIIDGVQLAIERSNGDINE